MDQDNFFERLLALPFEKQLYALQTLSSHLAEVGQIARLHHLLSDFNFMAAKLLAVGLQSLIADYQLNDDEALITIQRCLRLFFVK